MDELSPFEAAKILRRFRDELLPSFPFIWLKPDVTPQDLARDRPFLWLNIRAVCETSTAKMHVLGDRIRTMLANKVLVELERDTDILHGLMAQLGWFVVM